ncbi:UDP-2,4-diacetamido-2,4,6-trideoxy-beta-L-altropyranose hydrolase [Halobacteriovorax marinus]|uniref:UDP-2,4-diacetamido-2,4, 6-trideoxy-beta-L-altropyranose hydrolase n=1 Tax=Halobacteriovorax marinus TaxID=97084 RepID=UPI0005C83BE2|nr:UDP-2,4-diacetamido-2,4,6-trideoxy-beta-L-altropyranose hydrolase [Halobacteriovorax marinus]
MTSSIVFRVDSGAHIGNGHLFRCLSLAEEFREREFNVSFICRKHHQNRNLYIKERGFDLRELESNNDLIDLNNSEMWLGQTKEAEVIEVNELLSKISNVSLLVIDHYSIDVEFEKLFDVDRILVIDDLEREHCANIIIDQSLSSSGTLYKRKNQREEAKYLLGPRFALINKKFRRMREANSKRGSKRVLAYFGGLDLTNESMKVVNAFLSLNIEGYSMRVILPTEHKDFLALEEIARQKESIELLSYTATMEKEIAESELCLGASGVSIWERACLCKPSIVITSADNQLAGSKKLFEMGLLNLLGSGDSTTSDSWKSALSEYFDNPLRYQEVAMELRKICDGDGIRRVTDIAIEELAS